jgi:glyoxylase-like metal-dependent hydrolase (beta-lactamase superfamily II)
LKGDDDRIAAELEQAGYALSQIGIIVLTHAHGDHVGGGAALARQSGAQVVAHRHEVAYIEQTEPLPASSLVRRLMNWLTTRVLFRVTPCQVDRAVEDGDVIEALGGLRVVHAPGHTPGSIALHHPERQILFCGDALFSAHPMTGRGALQPPVRLFTLDDAQARHSVARLADLPVEVLCCGHGQPVLEGAQEKMRALLESPTI